ncbi:hypothetical protein PV326_010386 [Microctonus aethiopoides]|nr:hypothetical protein PV326_010386 [Microctonus aethiopoides]
MDQFIRTGFERIRHNIAFQPQTEPKRKASVESGHVVNVEEIRKINQSLNSIKASVIRQISISLDPYIVKLHIDSNRVIVNASCTCVYNRSEKCKHISALIYFINQEESLSKTNKEQNWGKPSVKQLAKEKYSKGKFFLEMWKTPKIINKIPKSVSDKSSVLEMEKPSALKSIAVEMNKDKDHKFIKNLLSEMVQSIDSNFKFEDCRVCVDNLFLFAEEYPVYPKIYNIEPNLQKFYLEEIYISKEQNIKLACDTLHQSNSKDWFLARRKRISAIRQYGIANEYNAKDEYEKRYKVSVIQVGVIVCASQPWLCASLDGVVVRDGAIERILEIKCPDTCKNLPEIDEKTEKANVNYLELLNGCVYLKKVMCIMRNVKYSYI